MLQKQAQPAVLAVDERRDLPLLFVCKLRILPDAQITNTNHKKTPGLRINKNVSQIAD